MSPPSRGGARGCPAPSPRTGSTGRCGLPSRTRCWRASSARHGGGGPQPGGEQLPSAHARSSPWRLPRCCCAVGQRDAALVQAPGGVAALVGGGPAEAGVASALRARGVTRVQVVVLTHAQEDHQGGLEAVIAGFPVDALLDGGHPTDGPGHRRIVALARARAVRAIPAAAGQRFRLGRALRLDVLAPRSAPEDTHGRGPTLRAAVLHVSYRGLDVLLPADAESEVTAGLALPPVDVLKVAHHGSADEGLGALLERLRPAAAVIPVGAGNRYGHPHPATMHALHAAGPRLFRTDRHG